MHLVTILAYACLFWRIAGPITESSSALVQSPWMTWLVVLGQPVLLGIAAWGLSRRTLARLNRPESVISAQQFYHRATTGLRALLLAGFAFAVLGTTWPEWVTLGRVAAELQILGDFLVLLPFIAGAVGIWVATYPVERALHEIGRHAIGFGDRKDLQWNLRAYLDFNVRHHILVVAVPMTLILFAANVARGYERVLRDWTGWYWMPDVLVGTAAAAVFVAAPLLLTRIWRTEPLESGPLRERLEALCARIGLRVRDILVWRSDGIMINAAVMGVLAPVRYVLLSDALLAVMTPRQVEAVFGHEAGHVRHHHIPHFLLFALAGWIGTAGVMELLYRIAAMSGGNPSSWIETIQMVGIATMFIVWGLGFGWLSRRFERQADLFAARSAAAENGECLYPCSVHPDPATTFSQDGRVCSTGAAVFASALERVAVLNGIPRDEPSWRHSSIGSRIRFLLSLAADPNRARQFDRLLRRIKATLIVSAILGSIGAGLYWWNMPQQSVRPVQAARTNNR